MVNLMVVEIASHICTFFTTRKKKSYVSDGVNLNLKRNIILQR